MTLTEREEHLALMSRLLSAAHRGTGAALVLRGPAGSGRTTLLRTFASQATHAGAQALYAVATRSEQNFSLGLMDQLFHNTRFDHDVRSRLATVMAECRLRETLHASDPDAVSLAVAPLLRELCSEILTLTHDGVLVIGIDDVRNVDELSLQCLLFLANRAGSARLLLVMTDWDRPRQAHPVLTAELLHQPHGHQIRLPLLSLEGVRSILTDRLGSAAAGLAEECRRISGGNPLLVNALVQDQCGSGQLPADGIVIGDGYAEALVSCLYRCEPSLLKIARGLATLGDSTLLSTLLDMNPSVVAHGIDALQATGVLDGEQFRHPAARAAVLGALTPEERALLHQRAARVLHEHGAAVTSVAHHLVESAPTDEPWCADVLHQAGTLALDSGDLPRALTFLRLSEQLCHDENQRETIRMLLASAEWHVDPSTAERRMPELTAAMRRGSLRGMQLAVLTKYLLWSGQTEQAREALHHLTGSPTTTGAEDAAAMAKAQPWLAFMYPALFAELRRRPEWSELDSALPATVDPQLRAIAPIAESDPESKNAQVQHAEQLLQRQYVDDLLVGSSAVAVSTLVYHDRLDRASYWCDRLLRKASGARVWESMFRVMRASISGRTGDLRTAERHARAALSVLPIPGWGVVAGLPIAVLVMVLTGMGELEEAAGLLNINMRPALFETPFGLHYLQARGRYHLAVNHAEIALSDFLLCGDLMRRWKLDLPTIIPWRSEAAKACRAMGDWDRARQLCEEELAMVDTGLPRARGITLRALAATSPVPLRIEQLRSSIKHLQTAGDRSELAHAYADLSQAQRAAGRTAEADEALRQARALAVECGLSPEMIHLTGPTSTPVPAVEPAVLGFDALAVLSEAEQRVAELAARGRTNREIANELFVTVSTVEQHLTRVYRKLSISNRSDLGRLPAAR
ncbi:AAA family ATPase [Actinoplanes sp. N902-109]|uniref:AAA family ATPase n=1 Tax=Actinoplanes sp. (strain N902-109) TaxID=649831 RepID=UPI00032939CD|nr:AAA family ATPase [Actinoplanes sp. N902-109]AGL15951.1 ATPase-like protein [Actinoplanes sp. N902-109]